MVDYCLVLLCFPIVCWVSVVHLTYVIKSLSILELPPCSWVILFPWWVTYSSVSLPNSGLSDPLAQWNSCYLSSTIIIVNVTANWLYSDLSGKVRYHIHKWSKILTKVKSVFFFLLSPL